MLDAKLLYTLKIILSSGDIMSLNVKKNKNLYLELWKHYMHHKIPSCPSESCEDCIYNFDYELVWKSKLTHHCINE